MVKQDAFSFSLRLIFEVVFFFYLNTKLCCVYIQYVYIKK